MTVAGLWTSGTGIIHTPGVHDMFFLPQKPYMPLGTLRQQLLYPSGEASCHTPLCWQVPVAEVNASRS